MTETTHATLTVHLELSDDRDLENVLKWIANGTLRPAIRYDWMDGGSNLGDYEGPLVRSVAFAHNGIEIEEN